MKRKRTTFFKTKDIVLPQKVNNILGVLSKYGLGLLGFLLIISLFRNVTTLMSANEKIAETQKELEAKLVENQKLQKQVAEAQSPLYKEQQARNQLGLARDGEVVLILPEGDVLKKISPLVDNTDESVLPDSNWRKWLKLFL
jgi:cell division protein FtsB